MSAALALLRAARASLESWELVLVSSIGRTELRSVRPFPASTLSSGTVAARERRLRDGTSASLELRVLRPLAPASRAATGGWAGSKTLVED